MRRRTACGESMRAQEGVATRRDANWTMLSTGAAFISTPLRGILLRHRRRSAGGGRRDPRRPSPHAPREIGWRPANGGTALAVILMQRIDVLHEDRQRRRAAPVVLRQADLDLVAPHPGEGRRIAPIPQLPAAELVHVIVDPGGNAGHLQDRHEGLEAVYVPLLRPGPPPKPPLRDSSVRLRFVQDEPLLTPTRPRALAGPE